MKHSTMVAAALLASGALVLTGCGGGETPSEPVAPITNPVAGEVAQGVLKGVASQSWCK